MSTAIVDITAGNGSVVTTNTTAVTGKFVAIQVMTGFSIPTGMTIYGDISAYTLSSGKVRAYKAR